MKKIAVTMGDPNGISPEITIKALNILNPDKENIVLFSNENILNFYKKNYNLYLNKDYEIINIPYNTKDITVGKETSTGGEFAFQALKSACFAANENKIDSIVTAPLSKNAIKMAGYNFSGQTEILEHFLSNNNDKAEMLFVCPKFSVFLLTRHMALKDVPQFIKKDLIISKVEKLKDSLENQLKIKNPKFAITALNPHAGENGLFGTEEQEQIIPAVEYLKSINIDIKGPFSADTVFYDCLNPSYNCYISMYHDQGLIPVKLLSRNESVNTTIGLKILRTSPSHGTAYDIAGKNIACPDSMVNALKLALNN